MEQAGEIVKMFLQVLLQIIQLFIAFLIQAFTIALEFAKSVAGMF